MRRQITGSKNMRLSPASMGPSSRVGAASRMAPNSFHAAPTALMPRQGLICTRAHRDSGGASILVNYIAVEIIGTARHPRVSFLYCLHYFPLWSSTGFGHQGYVACFWTAAPIGPEGSCQPSIVRSSLMVQSLRQHNTTRVARGACSFPVSHLHPNRMDSGVLLVPMFGAIYDSIQNQSRVQRNVLKQGQVRVSVCPTSCDCSRM
ncbi:hypothetical protein EDB87DRAFT_206565 [Lactarius vividus]|nr:hypothetical protein EDB87DRAFT_206565 [Lactarius vividus]